MEAFYDYGGGKVVTYTASVRATSPLEFEILEAGKKIGAGYCEGSFCHLDIPGHQAEETWFFDGGRLSRVGSMSHGAMKLIYTEKLARQGASDAAAEKLMLECQGFEHSDTETVSVYRASASTGSLVEKRKNGTEAKRLVTAEELASLAFPISPIYGMSRVIRKRDGKWILAYGCGEERPLSCREL